MTTTIDAPVQRRVLVVDDEPDIRELYQAVLNSGGFLADAAGDGEEALRLFKLNNYDLITLDCAMPGMDGVVFHRALSAAFGHGKRLSPFLPQRLPPVLIVTGYAQYTTVKDLVFGERVVGVLQKPVAPDQLLRVVQDLLDWEDQRRKRRAGAIVRLGQHVHKHA